MLKGGTSISMLVSISRNLVDRRYVRGLPYCCHRSRCARFHTATVMHRSHRAAVPQVRRFTSANIACAPRPPIIKDA